MMVLPSTPGIDMWFNDSHCRFIAEDITDPTHIIVDAGKNIDIFMSKLKEINILPSSITGSKISIPACFCEWKGWQKPSASEGIELKTPACTVGSVNIPKNNWF